MQDFTFAENFENQKINKIYLRTFLDLISLLILC